MGHGGCDGRLLDWPPHESWLRDPDSGVVLPAQSQRQLVDRRGPEAFGNRRRAAGERSSAATTRRRRCLAVIRRGGFTLRLASPSVAMAICSGLVSIAARAQGGCDGPCQPPVLDRPEPALRRAAHLG